jgi:hypothetical protein
MPEVGYELGANGVCEEAKFAEAKKVRSVNIPTLRKVWARSLAP